LIFNGFVPQRLTFFEVHKYRKNSRNKQVKTIREPLIVYLNEIYSIDSDQSYDQVNQKYFELIRYLKHLSALVVANNTHGKIA